MEKHSGQEPPQAGVQLITTGAYLSRTVQRANSRSPRALVDQLAARNSDLVCCLASLRHIALAMAAGGARDLATDAAQAHGASALVSCAESLCRANCADTARAARLSLSMVLKRRLKAWADRQAELLPLLAALGNRFADTTCFGDPAGVKTLGVSAACIASCALALVEKSDHEEFVAKAEADQLEIGSAA